MHLRLSDDAGTSLIELLVASVIIGASVVAILGALGTGVSLSSANATQSEGEAALRSAAEQVRAAPFVSCASTYGLTLDATALGAGLSAVVGQVRHYDVTTDSFTATCPVPDLVQLVTVTVTTDDGRVGDLTIDVAKRTG